MRFAAITIILHLASGFAAMAQSLDIPGATLADFLKARPDLSYVDMRDTDQGRVYFFAGEPQTVTTWLPPYVPGPDSFNNPQLGRGFNDWSRAVGTIPGTVRTQTVQCKVYLLAERVPKNGRTKSANDWRIIAAETSGPC